MDSIAFLFDFRLVYQFRNSFILQILPGLRIIFCIVAYVSIK